MLLALLLTLLLSSSRAADWPMLRGSARHDGFTEERLSAPFRIAWAAEFENERIGTAVEPIVANGTVFIATHAGSLYALDTKSGRGLWRAAGSGAILHSPAFQSGFLITASAEGVVNGHDAQSGKLRWSYKGRIGGYSAAPIFGGNAIYLAGRSGEIVSLALDGKERWAADLGVPIRQTPAFDNGQLFVTGEDLRVRAFDADGKLLWSSEPMHGQTARDYYPVILATAGKRYVIVRTNPLLTMSQRIGVDRSLLARTAKFDDSSWKSVDAWIKRENPRGEPQLWSAEQEAITAFLEQNPAAQSFFVFDAATGQRTAVPPVLWTGGCQSVGAPPARTQDGGLLTIYRTAYGNWNHGVAPLIGLGLLDVTSNRVAPLFHNSGTQPPWNTFWGTADESQNLVVAGETALIVHQGTLSGFDLKQSSLFKIAGERDTFGGFPNPPWARNEWHGPARAGVAVSNGRIFWQTGSRVLCLESGTGNPPEIQRISAERLKSVSTPFGRLRSKSELRSELNRLAAEILGVRWAPLFVDPGLNGREFFFATSAEYFEAFAETDRFLTPENQARAREFLASELKEHPPFSAAGGYALNAGKPREFFHVPAEYRTGGLPKGHPFGGLSAAWQWAEKTAAIPRLLEHWPAIQQARAEFEKLNWKLDPKTGDLFANRYILSLRAYAELATAAGATREAEQTRRRAEGEYKNLIEWWKNAATAGTLREVKGSAPLDKYIAQGDSISFRVAPHRHKIALFRDLTNNLFRDVLEEEPEAEGNIWDIFSKLYQTWPLQGEERQVHFGENFVDTPDLALDAFKVMGWQGLNSREELNAALDIPACRADLYYLEKIALLLAN